MHGQQNFKISMLTSKWRFFFFLII